MDNNEHQNDINNNNDASLTTGATDKKVEECMNDINIMFSNTYLFQRIEEEEMATIRNLLSSIHKKEWKQASNHFLRIYDNLPSYEKRDKALAIISTVLCQASRHHFQFPLGKEDNFKDFIDLFIGIDDENDENDPIGITNAHRQGVKGILLLLIVTHQSNTFVDVINILVDRIGRYFIINSNDIMGKNILSLFLESGNQSLDVVNRLIEVGGIELVMEKDRYGYTALHRACQSSNPSIAIVNRLIEVGGIELVMEEHSRGDTILHCACQSSNPSIDVINRLIEVGGRDMVMEMGGCGYGYGYTTLHHACQSDNPSIDVVNRLIEVGGRELVMKKDTDTRSTTLYHACSSSNPSIDIVNRLIEVGGRELVTDRDNCGRPTLHRACQSDNPSIDVVNRLIEFGGRELVMEKDGYENTSLHCACESSNPSIDVVNRLIEIGGRELVMEKGNYGNTSLHCACKSSKPSIDIVNRLIEVGGREMVMEKDENGEYTTLHWACQSSNPSVDVIKKLIEVGGREMILVQTDNNKRCHPYLLAFYHTESNRYPNIREVVVKTLIEEGLRLSLGGEFGIGGLFNCCTTTDDNGNTIHDHRIQIWVFEQQWNHWILPALCNEELKALLNGQPILHAAIIAKAPPHIIQDIINYFPQSVTFQDSADRHALDVTDEEGLKWDDGLKLIIEQFANAQRQTVMNVASYYRVKWNGGMEEVVEENEEQIGMVDQVTNFYPCMLAAVGDTPRNCDLSTVYNLMKRRPDLVKLYSTPTQVGRGKRKLEEMNAM